MRTLAVSGWGQPHDALSGVAPAAAHVDYARHGSIDDALAAIAKAGEACELAAGWSQGGQLLAQAIAAGIITPQRLVLIAAPFQFVKTTKDSIGMPRDTYDLFRENYKNNPQRTLRKAWELIAHGDEREQEVRAHLEQQDAQKMLAQDWHRWLDLLAGFSCDTLSFKKFPPTLLVHGDRDAVVWLEQSRRFAQSLPQVWLETWHGCGHAPHWHDAERLAKLIRTFANV